MIGHGECFLSLTLKEVLGMSRGFTTRHAKTSRDTFFLFKSGCHILGSESPQNNNNCGNSIPCETYTLLTTDNISACTDSDTALAVPAVMPELHWHCCRAEEPGYENLASVTPSHTNSLYNTGLM